MRKEVKNIDGTSRWVKVLKQRKPRKPRKKNKKPSRLDRYLSIVSKNKKKDYYKI